MACEEAADDLSEFGVDGSLFTFISHKTKSANQVHTDTLQNALGKSVLNVEAHEKRVELLSRNLVKTSVPQHPRLLAEMCVLQYYGQ